VEKKKKGGEEGKRRPNPEPEWSRPKTTLEKRPERKTEKNCTSREPKGKARETKASKRGEPKKTARYRVSQELKRE